MSIRQHNSDTWKATIRSLPPGLSLTQAAQHLDKPFGSVRHWIMRLGYKFTDGRSLCWPESRKRKCRTLDPAQVDWSQTNIAIAKQFGVSRERVRQIRQAMNIKKVGGRK